MTIPIVVLGLAVLAIRTWFQRRRLAGAKLDEPMSNRENALSADALQRLAAWSDAVETDELRTPSDVHDPQAWDRYWRKQIDVGTIEQGFNDMMSSDPNLIALLKRRGVRKILCAGVGLSSEPLALALHGFEVTALDISDIPRAAIAVNIGNGTHPLGRIPGLTLKEDGSTIAIAADNVIDQELCPPIHRSDDPPRGGGTLSYVTGDLIDSAICPGPFDAVIERRTLQLFPEDEQHPALEKLAARLGARAFLLRHYADDWLQGSDFVAQDESNASDAQRVARLYLTTG